MCSQCFTEALTLITYVGDSIARIECERCGYIFRISKATLYSHLLSDWETRSFSKPLRLAKEIRNDPSRFILTFPFRVMSKPLRMARELGKVVSRE
ncbi:hypothetical protein E3J84_00050 [Candidatus Aerophobetes bacterium]|uniref:Uncharacterized protein n=1 Tax=Aerophobetes bacterium TaxID=2030807 RepID=A0A523S5X1_UNCAE|nr:MAG: hypothetical protein E3J84_00050 [Candidatus Aerophobetes bacterium]